MDFQINEETYILRLAEDEQRWQFFVTTPTGARRIPVYVDAPRSTRLVVLNDEDDDEPTRMPN
jgi:hypothetical protein